MPVTSKNSIEVNGVSFKYDQAWVLKDVSFSLKKGDYVGIVGPNGGGKTTLLKLLLGILEPSEGSIKTSFSREQKPIGYVPQRLSEQISSFPATVCEIVSAHNQPWWKRIRGHHYHPEEIEKALEITGVSDLKNRLIGELSGGQLQRVLIARALIGSPQVLILDEPTLAIDVGGKTDFYQLLSKLNKEQKLTIVMVSHDVTAIAEQVQHVLCVSQSLVCHGTPKRTLTESNLKRIYGKDQAIIDHEHIHHH